MAEIVLGTSNAFAARNWPEPAEWTRIIAEDLRLTEVQFSFDLLEPTLPEPERSAACDEILRAVRAHGLSMSTTFTGLIVYAQNHLAHPDPAMRARAQAWYAEALAVTRRLSARGCGGHIGALSVRDYADAARRSLRRRQVIDAVHALTSVAAAQGLEYLLWELMPIAREIVHTPAEAIAALEEANEGAAVPVRLCFDLGHCLESERAAPADPYAWLERLLPWCPVVHLQQTDGRADRHWSFSAEHNAAGIIEPSRVIEIVRGSPLDRVLLLFEIAHAFDTPEDRVIDEHRASVEAWTAWL